METNHSESLGEQLHHCFCQIKENVKPLARLAVALYDGQTDQLYTFANSSEQASPLNYYQVPLSQVPSLKVLAESGQPRILDDLGVLERSPALHTRKILDAGYRSSFTVPVRTQEKFQALIFFDSYEKNAFSQGTQSLLKLHSQIIFDKIWQEMTLCRTLRGVLVTAQEFSRLKDEETAAHLQRMAHYSRLIALNLAQQSGCLNDEQIEHIFRFAPLHDLGKIAIPDAILLKKGTFTTEETSLMKSHVDKGVEIVECMIREFQLQNLPHIDSLRHIIHFHHERWNGSGYPLGLSGSAIPLESRIVAVADVFDALTTQRPYKPAWSYAEAFAYMDSELFDPDCVASIRNQTDALRGIQQQFSDDGLA
ncbi:MAG: HD domain-containing protein [Desulfuromonadaceae bacterium]|nr:HD domain-containing protein [Desulfuromonadaceae bacterium]